jgi:hypothetical protein
VVQLEKYFDFSLYSHHFYLLSLTSLLSTPEREVTSPSDFKVVGALHYICSTDTQCPPEVECLVTTVSVISETTNSNSLLPTCNTTSNDIQQTPDIASTSSLDQFKSQIQTHYN